MKLKELQIFGFKSFADKTAMRFGKGITIVVGPNGSGKSNIFDAIRWVLGEQSAKSLRGGKMEDVIFIGSDSRKTLGMAEVSIVFDNEDRSISMDYNEVKVTRRLYRSGESEYRINDNPVRLKDIIEMFMDTGVGIDAYSIIGQGEVDLIVNAKPVERREIFEEAAGITKYIKKRDEALRKLESTDQHMLRINDILSEVKRQAGSLERQAKKAEKYKELKLECDDMALKLYKKDIKIKSSEYKKQLSKNDEFEKKIEEEENRVSSLESEYEEMKLKGAEMERGINERRESLLIKQQDVKRLEESLKFLSERHVELEGRIQSLKDENVENVGKIENAKIDIDSSKKTAMEKKEALAVKEEELSKLNEAYERNLSVYEGLKNKREESVKSADALAAALAGINSCILEQEMALKGIAEKDERNRALRVELNDRLRKTEFEIEKMSQSKVLKEEEIKSIKSREEWLIKNKIKRSEELALLDGMIREMELSVGRLESKHAFFTEMHEKLEGYGETVKKILTDYTRQLSGEEAGKVAGAAASLISVDGQYEKAVEAGFASYLQSILVRDKKIVREIFDLYEKEKGDVSLLDSEGVCVEPPAVLDFWRQKVKHKEVKAYLPDVIKTSAGDEVIKLLFHNVFVVENSEKAHKVLRENKINDRYYLLTLGGEVISNYGIIRKGAGGSDSGAGFLGRERQIAEISSEMMNASGKLEALVDERVFRSMKVKEIEERIEELSLSYHNQYVESIKDDERIKQKEEDVSSLVQAIKTAEADREKISSEKEDAAARIEALLTEKKKMDGENAGAKAVLESLSAEINSAESALDAEKAGLEERKIELLKEQNLYETLLREIEVVENRLKESEERYNSTLSEIDGLAVKVAQADEEKTQNENKITEYKNTLSADESELNSYRERYEAYKNEISRTGVSIRDIEKERDTLKDEHYDIKLKLNELSMEVKNLYEKIEEEFKISPSEEEIMSVEIQEEEYRELSVKVSEHREKMEKLGVTSLVAIEEYNALKKRLEFLESQYNDMMTAKENLNKVIKKTNEQSKELFAKAFGEIKEKFAYVFKKMMNGGEADLLLTDSDDMLGSGIDIIARPPGKKLQNITLLSGGEKAITAISLLFSLFLIKASPFCIMDEVDAPLDDINIARFTNLVKGFKKTQFIIISHNKITMETADVLYGVSMEKAGVSRIISVQLGRKGELEPVSEGQK